MKNTTDPRLSKLAEALEMRSARPNTRATYLRCAGKFLDAVGKPIKQVTRGDAEQFLLAQARDGRAPRTRSYPHDGVRAKHGTSSRSGSRTSSGRPASLSSPTAASSSPGSTRSAKSSSRFRRSNASSATRARTTPAGRKCECRRWFDPESGGPWGRRQTPEHHPLCIFRSDVATTLARGGYPGQGRKAGYRRDDKSGGGVGGLRRMLVGEISFWRVSSRGGGEPLRCSAGWRFGGV